MSSYWFYQTLSATKASVKLITMVKPKPGIKVSSDTLELDTNIVVVGGRFVCQVPGAQGVPEP